MDRENGAGIGAVADIIIDSKRLVDQQQKTARDIGKASLQRHADSQGGTRDQRNDRRHVDAEVRDDDNQQNDTQRVFADIADEAGCRILQPGFCQCPFNHLAQKFAYIPANDENDDRTDNLAGILNDRVFDIIPHGSESRCCLTEVLSAPDMHRRPQSLSAWPVCPGHRWYCADQHNC